MRELSIQDAAQVEGGLLGILALAFARGYNTGTYIYEKFIE